MPVAASESVPTPRHMLAEAQETPASEYSDFERSGRLGAPFAFASSAFAERESSEGFIFPFDQAEAVLRDHPVVVGFVRFQAADRLADFHRFEAGARFFSGDGHGGAVDSGGAVFEFVGGGLAAGIDRRGKSHLGGAGSGDPLGHRTGHT